MQKAIIQLSIKQFSLKIRENYQSWRFMTNKAGKPWNKVRKQVYIKRDILFQHHKNKYIRGLIDRETYIRSLSYMFDVTVSYFFFY